MNNPLDRGAAVPVPTRGEGCTRRFDTDAMSDEHGADFADAPCLWRALQDQTSGPQTAVETIAEAESAITTALAQDLPGADTN
jgi:hypothetical protein